MVAGLTQYPPVWSGLREELEWSLVDILQATTQAESGLSPVSAGGGGRGEGGVGEEDERRGEEMLKSVPGNASTSTLDRADRTQRRDTTHTGGKYFNTEHCNFLEALFITFGTEQQTNQ